MHPLITRLLNDVSVSEIMVNGPGQIYVERGGCLERYPAVFAHNQEVLELIESILKPLHKAVSTTVPYADARLPDGSRVNVVIPPVAVAGPMITIRKFAAHALGADELVARQSASVPMLAFLKLCVQARKNIVVAGGTGSGKTTLLNLLSSWISEGERIISIEDTAELKLAQPHVGRLEAKAPDAAGLGGVTIRQLLINALRMRPDRIVIGECRGGEAFDMLQAMNSGHDGSLTTLHANTPRDACKRLEMMALMAGIELPVRVVREQIAAVVNIIVQVGRLSDGSRRITAISEVTGMEGEMITLSPLFEFVQTGQNAAGVSGHFRATQCIPSFVHQARAQGLHVDMKIFE